MYKNRIIIAILSATLVVVSVLYVTDYQDKKAIEDRYLQRDIRGSFSVMMLIHSELSRFINMYEREELSQDLLDEHRDVLWKICNTSTRLEGSRPLNNIRYLVVQDIDEVDEDLYLRYLELANYIFGIYLGIPDSYEVDGEVLSDEPEYLYDIFTSEDHNKEIQRIVGLD